MPRLTRAQLESAIRYNQQHPDTTSTGRLAILVAEWQAHAGLEVDGKLGPQTMAALNAELGAIVSTAPAQPTPTDSGWSGDWPAFHGPLQRFPRSREELYDVFGDPGTPARANHAWEKANIVEVRDLPGVPSKWYVKLHRLAEPYFREGLRRAQIAAPRYKIDRVGGFVLRHQRNDPDRQLSDHSWGSALDIDSHSNGGKYYTKGKCPAPWSAEWGKTWPVGLPKAFIDAMRSVGLAWGGTWSNRNYETSAVTYCDPMHLEVRDRGR